MRPLLKTASGVLATAALLLTPALAGTSSAAPHQPAASSHGHSTGGPAHEPAHTPARKPAPEPSKPSKPSKPAKQVELVGVVSATPTVVTTAGSDTSTVVLRVAVQGGDRVAHGTTVTVRVPASAVVKRNDGRRTRYDLQSGDKVTVHASRAADGSYTATYVAASGRPASRPTPAVTPASSGSSATRTATTRDDDDRD